jgi:hypothetical protein
MPMMPFDNNSPFTGPLWIKFELETTYHCADIARYKSDRSIVAMCGKDLRGASERAFDPDGKCPHCIAKGAGT